MKGNMHHIDNDGPFDNRCLTGGNVGDMYGEIFPWFAWCKSGCYDAAYGQYRVC